MFYKHVAVTVTCTQSVTEAVQAMFQLKTRVCVCCV